jgi:signal peptidase I
MGDNRDNSFDSRYFGPVERKRIVGQATAVALSFDRENYWFPRWQRFFTALDR